MRKQVAGICPVLKKKCTITINYLDASTFEGKCHVKGLFNCPYADDIDCNEDKCPIYEKAPENI